MHNSLGTGRVRFLERPSNGFDITSGFEIIIAIRSHKSVRLNHYAEKKAAFIDNRSREKAIKFLYFLESNATRAAIKFNNNPSGV